MQNRNLSEEERAFIESTLSSRDDVEFYDTDDGDVVFDTIQHVPEKRRNIFKSMYFWIVVVMTIPTILVGLMAVYFGRIAAMFGGTEVLDAIAEEGVSSEAQTLLDTAGLTWFPQFLEVYDMRWFIGAGVFTVFLLIAAVLLFIELYRSKK